MTDRYGRRRKVQRRKGMSRWQKLLARLKARREMRQYMHSFDAGLLSNDKLAEVLFTEGHRMSKGN